MCRVEFMDGFRETIEAEVKILGENSEYFGIELNDEISLPKRDDFDLLKKKNRQSNLELYKKKQTKVRIQGHDFVVEYYHYGKRYIRKKLPTLEFDNLSLNHMADQKRLIWRHFLTPVSLGLDENGNRRPQVYQVQDYPVVVLDIDDVPYTKVHKAIFVDKKWKFANKYHVSIAPSTSGKGVHIHILLDMSHVTPTSPFAANARNSLTYYKTTYRYKVFQQMAMAIAQSFETDTGIVPDYKAIFNDGIAITPREISKINEDWKGRSPVKITDAKLLEQANEYDPRHYNRWESEARIICNELDRALGSEDIMGEWMDYLIQNGIKPGKREYYEEVLKTLSKNKVTIFRHLARSLDELWFSRKKEEFSIPQSGVAKLFFGIESKRNETYVRHFVMYMLGLKVSRKYIAKRATNLYSRGEVERKYFTGDFLDKNWYLDESEEDRGFRLLEADEIASKLGNGNTWEVIKEEAPRQVYAIGVDKAINKMVDAIRGSSANDKRRRIAEVVRYIRRIESSREICLRQETG